MTTADRRQRLISSTPHLSAEEIATRSFSKGVRGYAESEVRGFLKRVSEELSQAHERERELGAALDALEEQLAQPRPLSEQELLDALGEETAGLLRSARAAADDIRRKAEERATQLVEDATADSERMRAEAADILAVRTREAEHQVADLMVTAEARANDVTEVATAEAENIVEAARRQGRDMLDEAKSARERVLGDLIRRRALLREQIEALRIGRDKLLDAYRAVKHTFLEATEALSQVEARTAAERSTTVNEPIDVAAEIAAEIEALDAGETSSGASGADDPNVVDIVAAEAGEQPGSSPDESRAGLADVDSLFARIRAGDNGGAEAATAAVAVAVAVEGETADAGSAPETDEADGRLTADEWRARRAAEVDPLLGSLLKKTKRTAQDDQNALLDAVRRHKGRPTAAKVLPDLETFVGSWSRVLAESVGDAYAAGRVAADAEAEPAGDDLVREAAESVVGPLRQRIVAAIDSGDAGDPGGLVERIGARFREWKNQSLERSLSEALSFVWARGVYDALPDDAVIWWVPNEPGRCSDCDDNALEPTVKGKEFPTGQVFPPAHPGCECLLAPDGLVNTAVS
jgi:DivIVA domain-containing protein